MNSFKAEKRSLDNYITDLDTVVDLFTQTTDQKERLDQLKEENIKDFESRLEAVANALQHLEENAQENKVENCMKVIEQGKQRAEDIEKQI